jgi:RNA polymerase sigma factor (sigma-70 family)
LTATQNILTAVVDRAAKGDANAQEQLYRQFGKAMYNICLRMSGNTADAEDLLQDGFVQAFNHLHQLKMAEQFGGWLKRIVVNSCIKHCKQRIRLNNLDENVERVDENDEDWWQHIGLDQIHFAIKQLPNGCREVFNLFVLEDYSHLQIAEALGMSVSTSKSQYHRARMLLRAQLLPQLKEHG